MAKVRKTSLKKVENSSDVPASQGQIESLRAETKSEFASQKLQIRSLEKRMDAKFDSLEAKIESLTAVVHRTNAIVEEQNTRNMFVLDGYRAVIDVQQDLDARVAKLEKTT